MSLGQLILADPDVDVGDDDLFLSQEVDLAKEWIRIK